MASDGDRTNGSEEQRAPENECENDGTHSAPKHNRRVSWNVKEAVEIGALNCDSTKHCHSSCCDNNEEGHLQTPEMYEIATTSPKKMASIPKSISKLSPMIESTVSANRNPDGDREGPTMFISPYNVANIQNVTRRDSCATSMDNPHNLHKSVAKCGSRKITPVEKITITNETTDEPPEDIRKSLLERVSQLEDIIISMKKLDTVQQGKSSIKEYELRTQLEGLCDDVLFLRAKKDRLGASLLDLHVKNVDLIRSEKNDTLKTGTVRKGRRKLTRQEKSDYNKLTANSTSKSLSVTDASVQTEDWLITNSGVRSGPPEPRRATSLRSIAL